MPRRLILTVAVLVVATIQPAVAAWPERPVQVIVPWPAGGTIDVMARPLAERFGEIFGQSLERFSERLNRKFLERRGAV